MRVGSVIGSDLAREWSAYRPENIQEKDRYPTCSIMVSASIMINGRTRLHVVANGTITGQRYIDEVLLPHDCLDSEGIQRLVGPALSPDLNPNENVWDALGEASCWSKLSSDKQELSLHSQRNGINCLNSCWIMLCKAFNFGRLTVNSPQSHIVRVYDAGHGKSGVFHSAEWHDGDWSSDGIREAWLWFFIWVESFLSLLAWLREEIAL
ncbi:hypothetical protein TNCV_224091 [Trichonephila clavipes]|nr:hypothetical protein TNCV_224091 [Trichonephila clavipes]